MVTQMMADSSLRPRIFDGVIGQKQALDLLSATISRPLHAYLLMGASEVGERDIARRFAAALLCEEGGCGSCQQCRLVLAGSHPDVVEPVRQGAAWSVGEMKALVRTAARSPMIGRRQVIVISDAHLAGLAGPVLLKTLEEPSANTVFVLLAEELPRHLATIASRCMAVPLRSWSRQAVRDQLLAEGVAQSVAEMASEQASGRIEHARLLANDPDLLARREIWMGLPDRLDGTGSAVALLVDEVQASLERALLPVAQRQSEAMAELVAQGEAAGLPVSAARKEMEEIHHRELRRYRMEELRAGLGALIACYRSRAVDSLQARSEAGSGAVHSYEAREIGRDIDRARSSLVAVETIHRTLTELVRNPNEALLLQALFLRLSAL